MLEPKFFEDGQQPQIRVISADPKMWYANRIGEYFHVRAIDPNDGGWYTVKEFDGSVKASDAEIGDKLGTNDITDALKQQEKRMTELKKEEEVKKEEQRRKMEEMKAMAVAEMGEQPELPFQGETEHPKPHLPYIRPRVEYDWDSERITEDLFIIFTDSSGNVHKGFVEYVEHDTIVMLDKSGNEHHVNMNEYLEGTIKVSFPEL